MSLPDPRKALDQVRKGTAEKSGDEETADLPPITILKIDVSSADGRRTYRGRWQFTVPTLGMKIEIGKLKTLYLPQGSAADMEALGIVETLAWITVCCTPVDEAGKPCAPPSWWDPINARDFTPYAVLYGEAMAYDRRFRGDVPRARSARDEDAADEEGSDGGGADRAAGDGLGGALPAAPERRATLASSRKRSG